MTTPKYRAQSSETMTPAQFLKIIKRLPASTPIADTIEAPEHYGTHKAHWIGWVGDYVHGRTYYGRKNHDRSAQYIWNHLQCGPMLVWLAEATDAVPRIDLLTSARFASHPDYNHWRAAQQCGQIRHVLPWSVILKALQALPRG